MADTSPSRTVDTNAPELRLNRFEAAWLRRKPNDPRPDWRQHLPTEEEPCNPVLIFDLLQIDIECRVKAGVPALLTESYFEHPRLQREDARLDAEQQVELIRWEYQQRWDKGEHARRGEYAALFPRHAEALRDLRPAFRCRHCRNTIVLEETNPSPRCPDCGGDGLPTGGAPPFVAESATPTGFDARGYQLMEQLGKGGMGEVYRCGDPSLGRDLAIKVMNAELCGYEDVESRFLREARVTGSLQHPGIVAVHNLGRLADGRLHYTMRLVRGQTFAEILEDKGGKPEELPFLLDIFEKMCQAVAYAHSKHVLHRDLKPANVMVGRFGEVQVMDWGLAKVLTPDGETGTAEERTDAAGTRIPTESPDTPSNQTRAGSALGTVAYMSPEQAAGDWQVVDERTDVFALGSILCEMLTRFPAYTGHDVNDLLRRARRGDLAEALGRLDECGADAALTALCRACLSPRPEDRPRNADAVAEHVKKYQAEVQERLRRAELERVAAETRAREEQARALVEQERAREALARAEAEAERAREARERVKAERRAKRRTLALAAAVMVVVVGGGGAFWWKQVKQDQADREALAALERGRERLEEGWQANNVPKIREALAEAERAAAIVRSGSASDAVAQQTSALRTEIQERLDRAEANEKLLTALLDIATPQETKKYRESGSERMMMTLAEPSEDEQYAAAFRRRWPDVEIEKQPETEIVARLGEEPEVVVQGVIAGLDGWVVARRRQKRPEAEWRRLLGLVERLDVSEPRRQLRTLLSGATSPSPESVTGLFGGCPPWSALWELARGNDWRRLRQLRGQMNAAEQPVLTVLLLAQASSAAGDMAGADEVLRLALARRPDEVALLDALGKVLEQQRRLTEAVGCYRAARAKKPALGVRLGWALGKAGQAVEGEAVWRDLLRQQPRNPEMLNGLGAILCDYKHDYEGAIACFRQAIALKLDYAEAYNNLGVALAGQGKFGGAEAAFRKAIALKPHDAKAYCDLGVVLRDQRKFVEAEAAYRKAIALKPDFAEAYNSLGNALSHQGKPGKAEAAYRKAIALKPDLAQAHYNLGILLDDQRKFVEAEAAYRKAIALKPDLAQAYISLGNALSHQGKPGKAEAAYRKAIALEPDNAGAHYNLGITLGDQGKIVEAEAAFRKAIALKPDFYLAYNNLGVVLRDHGKAVEAEAACRKAIDLKPDDATAYYNLGNALDDQRKFGEAEAAFRKAIALKPEDAIAYNGLGVILNDHQGKSVEAEAAFRKAIALKPEDATAYNNLGSALGSQGKAVEAEAAYRKAIALKPEDAEAYYGLGNALDDQRKFGEAEAAFRKAIALKPEDAQAYYGLGNALSGQGKAVEAEGAYRKAIALKPEDDQAYYNLGILLDEQGKAVEAEAAYRKAIALKPDDATAYYNLGHLLAGQEKAVEAEAAYRKAIALKPDYATAYCNLGDVLRLQGRFAESLAAYRRGHEVGSKQPGWRYPSLQWVHTAERMVGLEKKLAAVLQGEAAAANPSEAATLAEMCRQPYQKRYAAAARLYADAFAADPKLASEREYGYRYDAACSAALVAVSKGQDRPLPDKVAVMFRRWALNWLRSHLNSYVQLAEQNEPAARQTVQEELAHWRRDPDLASVRDPQALDRLSESERAAWQALWRDVDELAKRVAKQDKADDKREKREEARPSRDR